MAPQLDKSWGKGPTTIEDIANPPGRREPPVRYNVLAGGVLGPSLPAPIRNPGACNTEATDGTTTELHFQTLIVCLVDPHRQNNRPYSRVASPTHVRQQIG